MSAGPALQRHGLPSLASRAFTHAINRCPILPSPSVTSRRAMQSWIISVVIFRRSASVNWELSLVEAFVVAPNAPSFPNAKIMHAAASAFCIVDILARFRVRSGWCPVLCLRNASIKIRRQPVAYIFSKQFRRPIFGIALRSLGRKVLLAGKFERGSRKSRIGNQHLARRDID
jgi:hypothetical protein